MPFFITRRSGRGPDPWLLAKVRFFAIGAALALGGILLDSDLMVWGAMAVLAVGILLRFLPAPQPEGEAEPGEEEPVVRNGGGKGEG
jgi:hypothetical protein